MATIQFDPNMSAADAEAFYQSIDEYAGNKGPAYDFWRNRVEAEALEAEEARMGAEDKAEAKAEAKAARRRQ